MIALLGTLFVTNSILRSKNASFHIENQNAFGDIVKSNSKSTVIIDTAQLIWRKIRELGRMTWSEWVSVGRKYRRPPYERRANPLKCLRRKEFGALRALHCVIYNDKQAKESGGPIVIHGELPTPPPRRTSRLLTGETMYEGRVNFLEVGGIPSSIGEQAIMSMWGWCLGALTFRIGGLCRE